MIQFTVVYNYKNKLRKNGTGLVQLRAYSKGQCRYFSTNIYVTPFQWGKKINQVIDHPNTFQYNAEIRRQLNELESYTYEWIKKHGSMTLQQVEDFYRYEDVQSFTAFWKYELEHDTKLAKETKKKHKTALNYWTQFRQDVKFSELNFSLIHDFDTFLFSKNLHTNTVYTHHKQIRKYINLAISKEMFDVNKNPYIRFTPKTKPTERIVLTQEEVGRIEALTFDEENHFLKMVRDMFLFSCYTGLRFSDTKNIRFKNIEKDKEGYLINIISKKTDKQLILPLYRLYEKKPEELLKKYEEGKASPNGLVFYGYTNQYFNRALKSLAKLAEIEKPITSHVARHTFATHLAAQIPIHILKSILQHSEIETTMVYLHLSNKIVNEALDNVRW